MSQLQVEREEIKNSHAAQHRLDANDDAIRRVARQLRESTEVRRSKLSVAMTLRAVNADR